VEALDEVDPEELGADALGELDSDSELTSAPLPLIQLSTPPRANLSTLDAAGDLNETFGEDLDELDADELDEEDQDDDTDQGSVGPRRAGQRLALVVRPSQPRVLRGSWGAFSARGAVAELLEER
jgi:hypothetical protein